MRLVAVAVCGKSQSSVEHAYWLTSGRNKTNVDKLKLYSQRQLLHDTPGPNQGYRTAPVTDRRLHIYCINAIFYKGVHHRGRDM